MEEGLIGHLNGLRTYGPNMRLSVGSACVAIFSGRGEQPPVRIPNWAQLARERLPTLQWRNRRQSCDIVVALFVSKGYNRPT